LGKARAGWNPIECPHNTPFQGVFFIASRQRDCVRTTELIGLYAMNRGHFEACSQAHCSMGVPFAMKDFDEKKRLGFARSSR
jgi:hypothetical protein